MRLFLLLVILLTSHYMSNAQVDSTVFIYETFNLPPELDEDYVSTYLDMEYLPNLLYNGTPVGKAYSNGATLHFPGVPVTDLDSLRVSFYSKSNGSLSFIDHRLYISLDSIVFYQIQMFSNISSQWKKHSYTWINPFDEYSVEKVYYKLFLDTYSSSYPSYIEDFQIIGYTSNLEADTSNSCVDYPQSCYLDSNGDGMITSIDLLFLLSRYGNIDPCIYLN